MQHDFIYRGTLVQYWKVIFTHWKRSSSFLAEPPFEISAVSLSASSFADFVPKESETLMIVFYDEKHREIVSAFADAVFGKNIVKLTVFSRDEAFEERGESAVARWNRLKRSMERRGLLVDPASYIAEMVQIGIKPKKQKRGRYFSGIYGMLEKIAHRDYCLKQNGQSSNWSAKWQGAIDNKTANSIDRELEGKIKGQWLNPKISGDVLVQLLFKKYKDFEYLKTEWDNLKKKEF